MPPMLLPIVCTALVTVGVVLVVLQRRKQLNEVLVTVARREKGRVVPGPMGIFPMARIPLETAELLVSGVQGGKTRRKSTFAWIGCESYGSTTLDISQKPGRVGVLERIGHTELKTGHSKFDEAFWIADGDQDTARDLLGDDLREALLAFDPSLRVRLRVGELFAFPDGWRTGETEPSLEISVWKFPASVEVVERLVKVARLAHERLCRGRQSRAA